MIADILSNTKLNPMVTELFIRSRKLNISFVFITQSYFAVPKNIRLNSTNYFFIQILNKQELQQMNYKSLWKFFCKIIFFLVNDTALGYVLN